MMKSNGLIYLVATLSLFSACSTEENAGTEPAKSGNKVQLEADWDDGTTRTVMAAGGSVYWTTGDNVFCNSATALTTAATFSNQTGITTTGDARYSKAMFSTDEATAYSLLYPSTLSGVSYSGGAYTFTFPSSQPYYDNVTFSPNVNPSTAYSTSTSLKFKNACGIVKATINGVNSSAFTDVKAVRFIAGGQAVSGTATVMPTAEGSAMNITSTYAKGTNDHIDVTFATAIDLHALSMATPDASPTVYWVLPAGTYTTPTIELLNSSNKIIGKLVASKDITVTRANITRLGTLEMKAYTDYSKSVADYYWWDAYASYGTGSDSFSSGNYGYNPYVPESFTLGVDASQSCASCPTAKEIYAYLLAYAYYDDGSAILLSNGTYSYPPSYTLPNGITYNTYDTSSHVIVTGSSKGVGVWLPKNSYIKSAGLLDGKSGISGTGKGVEDCNYTGDVHDGSTSLPHGTITSTSADLAVSIRNSGNYFYLPASGYYDNEGNLFTDNGSFYWSSSADMSGYAFDLVFDGSGNIYINSSPRAWGAPRWVVQ